jgi:hypothetical protein
LWPYSDEEEFSQGVSVELAEILEGTDTPQNVGRFDHLYRLLAAKSTGPDHPFTASVSLLGVEGKKISLSSGPGSELLPTTQGTGGVADANVASVGLLPFDCEMCTFSNSGELPMCEMCGSPAPGM